MLKSKIPGRTELKLLILKIRKLNPMSRIPLYSLTLDRLLTHYVTTEAVS